MSVGAESLFDARPQFGSNGCNVSYEAVEDAMDEGDTGCPICGMAPGWHLTEDDLERSRFV